MKKFLLLLINIFLSLLPISAYAENIDPNNDRSQYAWGENVGWINLDPVLGPGITVDANGLTGYAWAENIGWINLSPAFGGVVNDGNGNLSGYAWAENAGWINFGPTGGGVFINACGEFSGTAWGENVGWIKFRSDGAVPFKVTTSWVSPVDTVPPVTIITSRLKGWYTTDTSIMFSATDCGWGVQEVRYAVNGGPDVITSGSGAAASVTAEGCTSLTYYSVDQAGNIEPPKQTLVCIDKTPPDIMMRSPLDNQTYYINSALFASYSVTDSGSGVASIKATAPNGGAINTSVPGSFEFSITARDVAGNQSSLVNTYTIAYPGNIDPDSAGCNYAWAENAGWINFKPSRGPGVTVATATVTGMAWGENIGWINLSPVNSGITNDGHGNLSGYAWAENAGWIKFNPKNGGVSIGKDGKFTGRAWGENIGWINFSAANSCLKTSWGQTVLRLSGSNRTGYNSIQYAYDKTLNDDEILIRNLSFSEDLYFGRNVSIVIRGGWDAAFDFRTGYSTISGFMTISSGKVEVDSIILR